MNNDVGIEIWEIPEDLFNRTFLNFRSSIIFGSVFVDSRP